MNWLSYVFHNNLPYRSDIIGLLDNQEPNGDYVPYDPDFVYTDGVPLTSVHYNVLGRFFVFVFDVATNYSLTHLYDNILHNFQ